MQVNVEEITIGRSTIPRHSNRSINEDLKSVKITNSQKESLQVSTYSTQVLMYLF